MPVVPPPRRLRRGVRRLTLAICALILGAGFTPALPSTVEPARPAPVSFNASAAAPATVPASTVDEVSPAPAVSAIVIIDGAQRLLVGRHVGAVTGRAPPVHPV